MHRKTTSHSCLECSKNQITCCTLGVPITISDIDRIISLGYKLEDFAEPGEWDDEELEGNEDWWVNSVTEVDGVKYKIHLKEANDEDEDDGRCIFLRDGEGCVLGDNRPSLCKLYPFWVEEDGKLVYDDLDEHFCPINKNILPIEEALKLLNETEQTIKEHYKKIKEDCINNKEKHRELILKLLKKE